MKTRIALSASVGIIASGLLAAVAFAGPGPQYWNRPASKPAEKPALTKMDEHPTGKCDGCKTTTISVVGDRHPAGKGAPNSRVVGSTHTCTGCVGKIVTADGKVKADMKHSVGCGPLLCCQ